MKITAFILSLFLAAGLMAVAKDKPGYYERQGTAYAVGETVRVVAARDQAELRAMKEAFAHMAELLEKKGLGSKKELELGVENAVTHESDLSAFKLGKVHIDSVVQERWEAPEGKDAWSVRVKISIRLH
jgi:hypothetical protein